MIFPKSGSYFQSYFSVLLPRLLHFASTKLPYWPLPHTLWVSDMEPSLTCFYFIWSIITQPLPCSLAEILPRFQAFLTLHDTHFVSDLCMSFLVWVLIAPFLPSLSRLVTFITVSSPSTVNPLNRKIFLVGASPNIMPIRTDEIFADSKMIQNSYSSMGI